MNTRPVYLRIKRVADIILSLIAVVVFSPMLLLLALWIKVDSPGPVLYRATRIGRNGKPFKLYKFRSMVVNADKMGPGITTSGDARITRVGKILRRTKLDELPQVFNVLNGTMSIVGPRPEDARYVKLYTPEQSVVLEMRPGITSLASVRYRHEEALLVGKDWETTYIERILPDKLAIELEYAQKASLLLDLRIIAATFTALFQ